jgi:hypothetical protein
MNLVELYDFLTIPDNNNQKVFNAILIPDYPNFRVAIDIDGNPVLLLAVANRLRNTSIKNFRLKYLQVLQNIECKISEKGNESYQTFTVLTFITSDRHLREYFLRVAESFIMVLGVKPTQEEVAETINRFVEVFRQLSDIPRKTVQGLWSELLIIDSSVNPKILLDYWHNRPEEKFDFNAGNEKIEVKSNGNFERVHTFSAEQLYPSSDCEILIASMFVRASNTGINIQYLVDSIRVKISDEPNLINKLLCIVSQCLGNSIEQVGQIKFDRAIAKESLQFYRQQDIHKIEKVNIPNEVFEVHYKSDLSEIRSTRLSEISQSGILFKSI